MTETIEDCKNSVIDYLQERFPAPFYVKTTEYEVGSILLSKDTTINATIVGLKNQNFIILTDTGNVITYTLEDLKTYFLSPEFKRYEGSYDKEDYYTYYEK